MRITLAALALIVLTALRPSPLVAQERPPAPRLRVFLDCEQWLCDFDNVRTELSWVDYVRRREDANVHVLVTNEETGAGGDAIAFHVIGLGPLAGRSDTLRHDARPDATEDETQAAIIRALALALIPYVVDTPVGRLLDIVYRGGPGDAEPGDDPGQVEDPWNLWVFRLEAGGEIEGESRERSLSTNGSVTANRTTEDLKIDVGARGSYEREEFELSDGDELRSTLRDFDVDGTVVWSMGPHWSVGAQAALTGSTRINQDLAVRLGPAIEYNFFPYAQSTRRQVTVLYNVAFTRFDYEEITVFEKLAETRLEQTLDVSASFREPWGELTVSVAGSNFLDDFSAHRVDLFANAEIRLFRGLSLDVEGSVARVKDQIYLPLADISDEDILLARRQLGTDFEYEVEVGLSFTFGSVFNNVVNPRMRGLDGDRGNFN